MIDWGSFLDGLTIGVLFCLLILSIFQAIRR
jgi:hypothetical protein